MKLSKEILESEIFQKELQKIIDDSYQEKFIQVYSSDDEISVYEIDEYYLKQNFVELLEKYL